MPAGGEAAAAGVAEPRRQPGGVSRRVPRAVHGRRARRERQGAARLVRCVAVTLRGKALARARGCPPAHTPGFPWARIAWLRGRAGALLVSFLTSCCIMKGLSFACCADWQCAGGWQARLHMQKNRPAEGLRRSCYFCVLTPGFSPQQVVLWHWILELPQSALSRTCAVCEPERLRGAGCCSMSSKAKRPANSRGPRTCLRRPALTGGAGHIALPPCNVPCYVQTCCRVLYI